MSRLREPRLAAMPVLLRACRPRQWVKNVLVLTAPIAAGVVTQPRALAQMLVAVIAFTVAASGIYLVNDALDVRPTGRTPRNGCARWHPGSCRCAQPGPRPSCSCRPRWSSRHC